MNKKIDESKVTNELKDASKFFEKRKNVDNTTDQGIFQGSKEDSNLGNMDDSLEGLLEQRKVEKKKPRKISTNLDIEEDLLEAMREAIKEAESMGIKLTLTEIHNNALRKYLKK